MCIEDISLFFFLGNSKNVIDMCDLEQLLVLISLRKEITTAEWHCLPGSMQEG